MVFISIEKTVIKKSVLGLFIWLLAICFFLYEFALRTILGTFTHQIIPALHLTPFTYSVMDSVYSLAFVLFAVPIGILADRIGIRWTMSAAMAVLASATFLYSFANDLSLGLVSRLLMGGASSLSFVSVVVIIMMWFPRRWFAFLVGISQLVATLGPMLGGGPLIFYIHHYHESWRMGLRNIAYFGFITSLLMGIFVREKQRNNEQSAYYIQSIRHVMRHLKALFQHKQVWLTVLYTSLCYAGFEVLCAIWGVEYLQTNGLSQQLAANCITCAWIGYALACPLLGFISDSMQKRKPCMAITMLIGFVASVYGFYWGEVHYVGYLLVFFLLGIAASGQSLSFVLLAEKVPKDVKASATAFNNSMIEGFVAAITLIASGFINHAARNNIANISPSDFKIAFLVLPISFILAFLICQYGIRETTIWFKQ